MNGDWMIYQCLHSTIILIEDLVIETMKPEMELVKLDNFSSSYFVGTRIIKVLLSQALGGKVNPNNPDMDWNKWFSHASGSWRLWYTKIIRFQEIGIIA